MSRRARPAGQPAAAGSEASAHSDSTTPIDMTYRSFRSDTTIPCNVLSVNGGGSAFFDYKFDCGDKSLMNFMNGILPLKIVSIRPNPAQEEITVIVEAPLGFNEPAVSNFAELFLVECAEGPEAGHENRYYSDKQKRDLGLDFH